MNQNSSNPIENLIDQIDQNETVQTCSKCLYHSKYLITLSCSHIICIECAKNLVEEKNIDSCPSCYLNLNKNLEEIIGDFFENPLTRLSYHYNINIGDVLWTYAGNNHNWLYSKTQCDQLNQALDECAESSENESEIEMSVKVGNQTEIYIVDFDTMNQYPKNDPSKRRKISCFKLGSLADLKKNKIIGVGGKYL